MPEVKRVGHKGADRLAPGNTVASFDAALATGVDMIEFDVLPERSDDVESRLVLAHDYGGGARAAPLTLDAGLDHLASEAFAALDFDVDLKARGYEHRVVDVLRRRDLLDRCLISSQHVESLAAIRAMEPAVRVGWSVPKASRDYLRSPLYAGPAYAALHVGRRILPGRAAAAIRAGRCDALMSHWRLVTPQLARAVAQAGGELYVWTVDDAARISALARLGVAGLITNDPRLFAHAAALP